MLLFLGCENIDQKPTTLDKNKQKYANELLRADIISNKDNKDEAKLKKELAYLEMEKEIKTKEIESKAKIEIEKIKSKSQLQKTKLLASAQQEINSITKIAILIASFIAFGVMILIFYIFKRYQENKTTLEREKMRLEKELREKELKTQMAQKLIETLANSNLTKEQQERLISLIDSKKILEYKSDSFIK